MMRWKRILAMAALALGAGGFIAGFVPQYRLRIAAERDAQTLRQQLAAAEARIRTGQLLGQALVLREVVMRRNYGQAQELASAFFDNVRTEATATPVGEFRQVLTQVLSRRDPITASLARADPATDEILREIESQLRGALGFSLPPAPPPQR